jgi:putative tryptophan/tyrosine transport system substrate-binding protein
MEHGAQSTQKRGDKPMNKIIKVGLTAMLLAFSFPVEAQQPKKVPRIGYLTTSFASEVTGRVDSLQQGLRELGYLEGKNLNIEYRYAEGKSDRLPALATELINLQVDLIVTHGFPPPAQLKKRPKRFPS